MGRYSTFDETHTYAAFGAIQTDGTLWSWGYNEQGGLGQNE